MPGKKSKEISINGYVEPGFESVKAEFIRNFTHRGECGAACAAYHQGRKVIDLWGGYRDAEKQSLWHKNTMVAVFSTTKGFSSLAAALAHSRGLLDYDEKVSTYWPEFGQNGKQEITVKQLTSHQAGLSALDKPLDLETLSDLDKLADILARQKPSWKPGTKTGYHCWSIGFYLNELIRRVDPKHRSIGRFFLEEIAEPLDAEFYIGLPYTIPDSRIAIIKGISNPFQLLFHLGEIPFSFVMRFLNPRSLTVRSMNNPRILFNHKNINRRDVLAVEVPSGNGIGVVRDMAKIYNEFLNSGKRLIIRRETLKALQAPPDPSADGAFDVVLRTKSSFSLGFTKPSVKSGILFGSSGKSFGSYGAGGSFAYADPDAETAYAYAMNKLGFCMRDDPREKYVREAFYRSLHL